MNADTCPACGTVATMHAGCHLTETCRCSEADVRAALAKGAV